MKEIWVYESHNASEKLASLAATRVSAQRRASAARLKSPEDKLPLLLGEAFVRAAAQPVRSFFPMEPAARRQALSFASPQLSL